MTAGGGIFMCRRNQLLGAMLFTLGLGLLLASLVQVSCVTIILGVAAMILSWIICRRC